MADEPPSRQQLAGVALVFDRKAARVMALLVTIVVLFGLGFEVSRSSLAQKRSAQKGELLLYPWRTFGKELESHPRGKIGLSGDLRTRYHMTGGTETAIARLALVRRDVRVDVTTQLPAGLDTAIASRMSYESWLREMPSRLLNVSADANRSSGIESATFIPKYYHGRNTGTT